jgi:isoleucyl-tRNA synthetase
MTDSSTSPETPQYNPARIEQKIIDYRKENSTFERSIETRSAAYTGQPEQPYRFYDGPPFITGLPHPGSLLSSVVKDVMTRYRTQKGKRIERVWGWDCHGIYIEQKVQEKLGYTSNLDIEAKGIGGFIEGCQTFTKEISDQRDWYIDHIGRRVDFKNAYKTMDNNYMESVLWVFKSLRDKGLVYKGKRVSLYSTKLNTPISNYEVAMDNSYADVSDPAVTVKFPVVQKAQAEYSCSSD